MRRRILPFDIWLCLLLAFLVSLGTGAAAGAAGGCWVSASLLMVAVMVTGAGGDGCGSSRV